MICVYSQRWDKEQRKFITTVEIADWHKFYFDWMTPEMTRNVFQSRLQWLIDIFRKQNEPGVKNPRLEGRG